MQIKKILLLAFVLTSNILQANSTPTDWTPSSKINGEESCQTPPPSNFHIIEVGATWVHLGWDIPAAPKDYRIRIFRVSDGLLLSTTDALSGIEAVRITVPIATPVDVEIRSVCTNGEEGDGAVLRMDGIILDLIVKSFAPEYVAESCTLKIGNPTCCFTVPGVTTFIARKATHPSDGRAFTIEKSITQTRFHLRTSPNNLSQSLWIQSDNHDPVYLNGAEYEVKTNPGGLTVARFDVGYSGGGVAQLKLLSILNGYEIVRLTPCFYGRPEDVGSVRERDASSTIGNWTVGVAPNPFFEQLDLFLPQIEASSIHIGLFNLSGQKVLEQQFSGGQEQYTLNTAELSPGFYLLRIEADGEVQTLKVVKSE